MMALRLQRAYVAARGSSTGIDSATRIAPRTGSFPVEMRFLDIYESYTSTCSCCGEPVMPWGSIAMSASKSAFKRVNTAMNEAARSGVQSTFTLQTDSRLLDVFAVGGVDHF